MFSRFWTSVKTNAFNCYTAVKEETEKNIENSRKEFATTEGKIKTVVGLGLGMLYYPANKIILKHVAPIVGLSSSVRSDPFGERSLTSLVLHIPLACVIGPIMEECVYRGGIQDALSNALDRFRQIRDLSGPVSRIACLAANILFTTTIFSITHLTNIPFSKEASEVYAQTITCFFGGIVLSAAKELSKNLLLPIGFHIGFNVHAWINNISYALSEKPK